MIAGWFTNPGSFGKPLRARFFVASGVILWFGFAVLFALLPAGSTGRSFTVAGAAFVAYCSAGVALSVALRRGRGAGERLWAFFGVAVLSRLVADAIWTGARALGFEAPAASWVSGYAISFALFFVVMAWLVGRVRQEMVSVAALDAAGVMLTSGMLALYFVFPQTGAWDAFLWLSRPVCDLGLLFLSLAAVLTVRPPPFISMATGGLSLLMVGDGAYLWSRAEGLFGLGAAEVLWAGGAMLLAFAASSWAGAAVEPGPHVGDYGVALFWFGPLSPLLQYGFLLAYGALYPPLPPYVLLGGAVLAAVLAVRMYGISHANGIMARRQEALALQAEQGRILRGLHDTVKQEVHGASMLLEAAAATLGNGDEKAAREVLEKAHEALREAGRDLSRPLDELRAATGHDAGSVAEAGVFFRERLKKLEDHYGMRAHEDFAAPLGELNRGEIVAAQQIFVEAAWNAAKHSGAENFWLSTRREGPYFTLSMRDDGCGYDATAAAEKTVGGLGMNLMRSRAEGVGAALSVEGVPGGGVAVEVRFGKR